MNIKDRLEETVPLPPETEFLKTPSDGESMEVTAYGGGVVVGIFKQQKKNLMTSWVTLSPAATWERG